MLSACELDRKRRARHVSEPSPNWTRFLHQWLLALPSTRASRGSTGLTSALLVDTGGPRCPRFGKDRYSPGQFLVVDRYLEFAGCRSRLNTVPAIAVDLKSVFGVVAEDPLEIRPVDVFESFVVQRGGRAVCAYRGVNRG